ncbi:MAG: hypothetical protein ACOYN0_15675, partial [Phycisphaerales bacterium]
PVYRLFSGAGWSAAANLLASVLPSSWVVVRNCPVVDATACVLQNTATGQVQLTTFNGSTWSAAEQVVAVAGNQGTGCRGFDAVYDNSGLLMIAHYKASSGELCYRRHNGMLASESVIGSTPLVNGFPVKVNWVTLVNRPCENRVLLMALDADSRLYAALWSGTSWGPLRLITSSAAGASTECYAAAFESLTGTPMIVYGNASSPLLGFRRLVSGSWSDEQGVDAAYTDQARWVVASANPISDGVAIAAQSSANRVRASIWDGAAWASTTLVTGACQQASRRSTGLSYLADGSKALVLYSTSGSGTISTKSYNGTSWSGASTGGSVTSTQSFGALFPGPTATTTFSMVLNTSNANSIRVNTWSGSTSVSGPTALQGTLMGFQGSQSFFISTPRSAVAPACQAATKLKVKSWNELDPSAP